MGHAVAYRAAGLVAESIDDCNCALALDPTPIQSLDCKAAVFQSIRCLPDCLHDLEHLKLLNNSKLRDRKLPSPTWKRHYVQYRQFPCKLCVLTVKIQELEKLAISGEKFKVDYYALIGLQRECSRPELERTHLLAATTPRKNI